MTGASSPMMGNFKFMLMILIFLTMNGHHYLLSALMHSYEWIPLSNDLFARIGDGTISEFLTRSFSNTFLLALQLSAPLVVAMFLTDIGLGFLAKTAPQYNVFVIGMPLKIIVGFLLLLLIIPGFTSIFELVFAEMFKALESLLQIVNQGQGTP
jgi:flagellar biosynthetic protein FliR